MSRLTFSNVPGKTYTCKTPTVGRRWQVELAIKRLKSLLNIDQLRAKKNSALADLYLHGKLL